MFNQEEAVYYDQSSPDILSPPEPADSSQNQMQVMCDQIQYLHNELNKLKGTSYKVLIDNDQLKKENIAL